MDSSGIVRHMTYVVVGSTNEGKSLPAGARSAAPTERSRCAVSPFHPASGAAAWDECSSGARNRAKPCARR
jgi:hypothetical protein